LSFFVLIDEAHRQRRKIPDKPPSLLKCEVKPPFIKAASLLHVTKL
jgi:hypothetical protein